MDMETEGTFKKKCWKTGVQCTRVPMDQTVEMDEIDHEKMMRFVALVFKIAKRLRAEEKAALAISEVN